ncbi:MAG: hypothetical protein K2W95_03105 [Candidatus Obscuribacterales bacterium]|nr:hypothetical protein [Candidatus Obscuribacterales bacterium]
MLGARFYGEMFSKYVQAGSPSCSKQLLEQLAHSEVDRIRQRVAENPGAPIDLLELLASDRNVDVRIAVGTNPSTPEHIRYRLAFDEDPNVRLGLAEDVNTPLELIEKLTEDENPYVSCRALETEELILSRDKPRDFGCHRFFRWAAKGADLPEQLRYA